jgi:Xaa-Pro aminopeptidase
VYADILRRFGEQIAHELEFHKLKSDKIGIDVEVPSLVKALNNAGVRLAPNGDKALMKARATKTRDEVECHRIAAAITEAGFDKVKSAIRPGVSEMELRGIFMNEVYRLGADFAPTADIMSGPRSFPNNQITTDRLIRPQELIVFCACNLSYMGYRTCYYRTFSCGAPNQAQRDTFTKVRDYLYDAIKLVRPGATTKELAEKWPRAEEYGWPDEDTAFWMQWGHGIGLSIAERPTVTRIWSLEYPERLDEGMVIALETLLPTGIKNESYPESEAVRLEEMLYVTEGGHDLLSRWPIDEITACNC